MADTLTLTSILLIATASCGAAIAHVEASLPPKFTPHRRAYIAKNGIKSVVLATLCCVVTILRSSFVLRVAGCVYAATDLAALLHPHLNLSLTTTLHHGVVACVAIANIFIDFTLHASGRCIIVVALTSVCAYAVNAFLAARFLLRATTCYMLAYIAARVYVVCISTALTFHVYSVIVHAMSIDMLLWLAAYSIIFTDDIKLLRFLRAATV